MAISAREIGAGILAFTIGSLLTLFVDKSLIKGALSNALNAPIHNEHATPTLHREAGLGGAEAPDVHGDRAAIYRPVELGGSLTDTAWVSMASNDETGQLALTMFQSLRDTGTKVPHLVLMLSQAGPGSADCMDHEWRKAHGREHIDCSGTKKTEPEIVSERYLKHLRRLGVETMLVDPIPLTPYTKDIPGGATSFWGAAFNKLKIFNLTQFKKAVWLDADDYFVRNVDHLMGMPSLTGSVVTACCHAVGPAYPGGGIFVTEPSAHTFDALLRVIAHPRPGTLGAGWDLGDMQVIRHYFGAAPYDGSLEPLYPAINDLRHGYVGGLRYFKKYRDMSQEQFDAYIDSVLDSRKLRREGFIPELRDPSLPNYESLDMRYDQCVGTFKCAPERDEPDIVFSVHFSCLQTARKPSQYASEKELLEAINAADEATRYWFLMWYHTYRAATLGEGFPAPKWTEPLPVVPLAGSFGANTTAP